MYVSYDMSKQNIFTEQSFQTLNYWLYIKWMKKYQTIGTSSNTVYTHCVSERTKCMVWPTCVSSTNMV